MQRLLSFLRIRRLLAIQFGLPLFCDADPGSHRSAGSRRQNEFVSFFTVNSKALTSMTPLQYPKQLRLLEARRLMVADAANVETAAFEVGYESPSQFCREYSRMFGLLPRRDIQALRRAAA
jgi:methylphosphotriester-DNA--protein-cysteine methyltransferase